MATTGVLKLDASPDGLIIHYGLLRISRASRWFEHRRNTAENLATAIIAARRSVFTAALTRRGNRFQGPDFVWIIRYIKLLGLCITITVCRSTK